jgi:hypothetical protein
MVNPMNLDDAILRILDHVGTGVGRTTLQKLLYFASIKGIIQASFRPYYYGPYADEAYINLENLVSLSFVEEASAAYASGHSGYQYLITPDGKTIISGQSLDRSGLDKIVDLARTHFGLRQNMLATAAKVHYILMNYNTQRTIEAITHEARNLGWEVSQEDAMNVVAFLKDMDLIKIE